MIASMLMFVYLMTHTVGVHIVFYIYIFFITLEVSAVILINS